jgi:hypothetical protein
LPLDEPLPHLATDAALQRHGLARIAYTGTTLRALLREF